MRILFASRRECGPNAIALHGMASTLANTTEPRFDVETWNDFFPIVSCTYLSGAAIILLLASVFGLFLVHETKSHVYRWAALHLKHSFRFYYASFASILATFTVYTATHNTRRIISLYAVICVLSAYVEIVHTDFQARKQWATKTIAEFHHFPQYSATNSISWLLVSNCDKRNA